MASDTMDLEALKNDISEKASEVMGKAVEFAREKPHAAVGVAFGIGWILGNGLPPRLIMAGARIGWKAALGGMLASGGLAGILGRNQGGEEPTRAATTPASTTSSGMHRGGGMGTATR